MRHLFSAFVLLSFALVMLGSSGLVWGQNSTSVESQTKRTCSAQEKLIVNNKEAIASDASDVLVVVVHGLLGPNAKRPFSGDEPSNTEKLWRTVEAIFPNANILKPDLSENLNIYSSANPNVIVDELIDKIDKEWAKGKAEKIVLVGYSAGGLLIRDVFTTAWGFDADGKPKSKPDMKWAKKIDRIISIGGIVRGWELRTTAPSLMRFLAPIYTVAIRGYYLLHDEKDLFISQLRSGSPYVIEARLRFHDLLQHLCSTENGEHLPLLASVNGNTDGIASIQDSVELGQIDMTFHVALPMTTHEESVETAVDHLAEESSLCSDEHGHYADQSMTENQLKAMRASKLLCVLRGSGQQIKRLSLRTDDLDDYFDDLDLPTDVRGPGVAENVQHVVFVLHGIRDTGNWTKRLAARIREFSKEEGEATAIVRAPTPSYGFFSLWDFVRPYGREQATDWFRQRYADLRTIYPNAKISFVGHSNGTFLALDAMKSSKAFKFKHIVLAGSMARTDYPWAEFEDRFEAALNFVATNDWVVALLPGAFESITWGKFKTVGGAGHNGFVDEAGNGQCSNREIVPVTDTVLNVCYVEGAHGAALAEYYWDDIANFIVDGLGSSEEIQNNIAPTKRDFCTKILIPLTIILSFFFILFASLFLITWLLRKIDTTFERFMVGGAVVLTILGYNVLLYF